MAGAGNGGMAGESGAAGGPPTWNSNNGICETGEPKYEKDCWLDIPGPFWGCEEFDKMQTGPETMFPPGTDYSQACQGSVWKQCVVFPAVKTGQFTGYFDLGYSTPDKNQSVAVQQCEAGSSGIKNVNGNPFGVDCCGVK